MLTAGDDEDDEKVERFEVKVLTTLAFVNA